MASPNVTYWGGGVWMSHLTAVLSPADATWPDWGWQNVPFLKPWLHDRTPQTLLKSMKPRSTSTWTN